MTSLLEESKQLTLSSIDMPDELFRDEKETGRNPEFTARRFFSKFPEKYSQIVALRCEGLPVKVVAEMFHVSRNTVDAIDRNEAGTGYVEQQKGIAAADCRQLARLCRERLRELLLSVDGLELKDLSIALGILEEKALLLAGSASSRVEHVHGEEVDGYGDLLAVARAIRERMSSDGERKGTNARVIDVTDDGAQSAPPTLPAEGGQIMSAANAALPLLPAGQEDAAHAGTSNTKADGTPAAPITGDGTPEPGGEGVRGKQGAGS